MASLRPARPAARVFRTLFAGTAVALTLCACSSPPAPVDPAAACSALAAPIDAGAIGLPTRGASIETTSFVPASAEAPVNPLPFVPPPPEAVIVPAMPAHCRVVGRIASLDPAAPPIRFQVNLPEGWTGRYLQVGGGGFNGALITGLALPPSARIDRPGPLMRGFVTAGTDSGHANAPGVPLQQFAINDEALENFAHASYKKVRDVAVELMKRRYGKGPDKAYFMGSSEGGREGLTMAQRYPRDFDGIFSRVPVIAWTGLQAAGTRMGTTQMGAGWLSPAHVKVVHDAVLAQCDRLDGLADGVIGDYEGCRRVFDPAPLRCAGGATSSCLNDAQLEAVRTLHTPYESDFVLANGAAHLSRLGLRRRGGGRQRPGRRLRELADGHRAAGAAGRSGKQPRLALRQRRDPVVLPARRQRRPARLQAFGERRAGGARLRADGFDRPRPRGLRRARRQAGHERAHGRLRAEPVRRHRLLEERRRAARRRSAPRPSCGST